MDGSNLEVVVDSSFCTIPFHCIGLISILLIPTDYTTHATRYKMRSSRSRKRVVGQGRDEKENLQEQQQEPDHSTDVSPEREPSSVDDQVWLPNPPTPSTVCNPCGVHTTSNHTKGHLEHKGSRIHQRLWINKINKQG